MLPKVIVLLSKPLFCKNLCGDRNRALLIIPAFLILLLIPLLPCYSQILVTNPDSIPFAPAVNYSTGTNPRSVFCADLDGDGDLDLAVANGLSNNVSILKNNGDGTYQGAVNYDVGEDPFSVFCADLDGDGDLDLAVANATNNNVSILKNNGNGTFQSAVNYGAGNYPVSVFCADLDNDNDLDLAVANYLSDNISILKNNGDGTFASAVNYLAGYKPHSVFCADLDGDTDLDLAVANMYISSSNVSILKNNGDGTFASAVNYVAGSGPHSVFCADLDNDNDLDLAVANRYSNNVSILKNNGDGTFASAVNYGAGSGPLSVFCADLDNDNDLDLAVANYLSDNVSILKNNGDGTYPSTVNYGAGNYSYSVFCADLDGDGDKDLAVANVNSDNVSILLNLTISRPNSFSLISPSFDDSVRTPATFSWQTAIDPRPDDTVRYDLYLSRSTSFNPSPESSVVYDSLFDTTFTDSPGVGLWYWKVKAYDEWGAVRWSNQTWSFWVLSPPDNFSLLSPQDGELIWDSFTFSWQTAFDPDPNDTVRFDLYISRSSSFDSSIIVSGLNDTSFIESLGPGLWYWKVKAYDKWGLEQWSTQTNWSFYVLSGPEAFCLISPSKDDSVKAPLTLCWHKPQDLDPFDTVRYDLYLSRFSNFNPDLRFRDLEDTCYADTSGVIGLKLWYWKVKAHDIYGFERFSCDTTWSFYAYLCGDCNGDGVVNVGDVVWEINYLFKGGPPQQPYAAGDVNCDGIEDIGDVVYKINYLFKGGPEPCLNCP